MRALYTAKYIHIFSIVYLLQIKLIALHSTCIFTLGDRKLQSIRFFPAASLFAAEILKIKKNYFTTTAEKSSEMRMGSNSFRDICLDESYFSPSKCNCSPNFRVLMPKVLPSSLASTCWTSQ